MHNFFKILFICKNKKTNLYKYIFINILLKNQNIRNNNKLNFLFDIIVYKNRLSV